MHANDDHSANEYKRARRKYLSSIRTRDPALEADWTAFRAAEKKFKAKFPPPSLQDVLDLALLDSSRAQEIARGRWAGRPDAVQCHKLSSSAYAIPAVPGLVVLPNFLSVSEQKNLIHWALDEQTRANETNLHTHYILPDAGLWRTYLNKLKDPTHDALISTKFESLDQTPEQHLASNESGPRKLINNEPASASSLSAITALAKSPPPPSSSVRPLPVSKLLYKLRWTNIGWYYHWGTKQYDFVRGKAPINPALSKLCQSAVKAVDWAALYANSQTNTDDVPPWQEWPTSYEPDAGIVNFYQNKDSLMAHVDRSELCDTSPLVSVSLGQAAVFLIGDDTRETPPTAILLRSGDVVIMSGPCRRAYHGVPRILEGTSPFHDEASDWQPYQEYMTSTRININLRQVFPLGFTPDLGAQC